MAGGSPGLAVLLLFDLMVDGVPTLDAHESLAPSLCGISSCEAAAGSLLYIMPALVHLERI